MEITEIKVFLRDSPDKKLKAYVAVTFDNVFVVRNIKIIEGSKGLFIAMPSRKIKQACIKCGFKNESRSKFCNQCGIQMPQSYQHMPLESSFALPSDQKDVAHPITQTFRDYLQKRILDSYEQEKLLVSSDKSGVLDKYI